MRVLIVGGTGLVGGHIIAQAPAEARLIVSGRGTKRPDHLPERVEYVPWDTQSIPPFEGRFDAVVDVAGANLAGKRWSDRYRRIMRRSRVDTNRHLAEWIREHPVPPAVFVTASAVGYYGIAPTDPCLETHPPGDDHLARLCADWERAARDAESNGKTRVTACRCGVVLDAKGGALAKMRTPFLLGLGGRIGDGTQPFPWVSGPDAGRAYWHAILRDDAGDAINVVGPHRVTNATFARSYGAVLRRPAFFVIPTFVLRLVFGESATLLTNGQDVVPARLDAAGFEWRHPEIGAALAAAEGKA